MKKNKFNKSVSTNTNKKLHLLMEEPIPIKKKIVFKQPTSLDLNNIFDFNYDYNKDNNGRYYYKNPQFLNSSNIKKQINILMTNINNNSPYNDIIKHESTNSIKKLPKIKSLNNLDDNSNIESIDIKSRKESYDSPLINGNKKKENIKLFPNISTSSSKIKVKYLKNISSDFNPKNDINYIYKSIFSNSALFKEKKRYIDNKLNIVYCQNEAQYKFIMEKRNKLLKNKGAVVLKYEEDSEKIKGQVDEIKTKIKFMKNIMDYSYPGFMLTKIQTLGKKLSNKKNNVNLSPIEKQNFQIKKRNILRMNYLKQNFKVFPLKI